MKKAALLAVIAWSLASRAFAAGAGCSNTAGPLTLEKVRAGASGTEMFGCINRSLDVLSSSAVYSGTGSTATFKLLRVGQITGLSGGGGVWVSSNVTVTSSMTLTGDIWLGGTIRSSVTMADAMSALTGSFGSSAVRPLPLAVMVTSTYGFSVGNLLREVRIGQYPGTDEPAIQGFKNNDQSNIVLNLNPDGGTVVVGGSGLYSTTNTFQSNGATALNSSLLVGGPSSFSGSLTARSSMTITEVTASGTISATHFVATDTVRAAKVTITGSNAVPFTIGVSTMYVDGATGSVGIGTTNPVQKLDVAGSVSMTGNVISSGTGTNQFAGYIKTNTGANDTYIVAQNAGADNVLAGVEVVGGGTGADWIMFTNRSNLAGSQESLGFYKFGGTGAYGTGMKMVHNGIGLGVMNIAPVQALDVTGNITNSGVVHSSGTGTSTFGGGLALAGGLTTAGDVNINPGTGFLRFGGAAVVGQTGSETRIIGTGIQFNANGDATIHEYLTPTILRLGVLPTVSTYTHATGGLALSGPLSSASYIQMASKTVAQLEAITPTATGQQYYCSNCLNGDFAVISTGTAVCQFAAMGPSAAWH